MKNFSNISGHLRMFVNSADYFQFNEHELNVKIKVNGDSKTTR